MEFQDSTAGSLSPRTHDGKQRILIVDDNADAANSLGRLLTLLGIEIRVVHSGEAALSEMHRFRPHGVLLDLGMPIMDGFDTAEQIRAHRELRNIPLIAVTGWGQDRDRQRTDEAGFVAHLIKPVNLDQLESVLRAIAEGAFSSTRAPVPSSRA
jgi:CheY-like chemotaxis protein